MNNVTESFLDNEQYARESIEAYEAVFGREFLSPGGATTATALVASLGLRAQARVLDVGCGLGGSAFLMAREHALRVDGIDLSRNMISLARERLAANGLETQVRLEHGDCLELERPERYDAVYSRDVFLHIHDKTRLFAVLGRCLRPGGRLLFTDYCCGSKPWSENFSDYVAKRAYHLLTVNEYASCLEAAGFIEIAAQDRTQEFIEIARRELDAMNQGKLAPTWLEKMRASWADKIERAQRGDQRWGLMTARKP